MTAPWLPAERSLLQGATLLLLAGCAALSLSPRPAPGAAAPAADPVGDCRRLFSTVDDTIAGAGVGDAQSAPVPGLPYLRIDRFLAAVEVPDSGPAFEDWVDRLRHLDREARQRELANLTPPAPAAWAPALERCATVLRAHDLDDRQRRAELRRVRVADDYRTHHRVLGGYPLTALPFLAGVGRLHRQTAATFATALDQLPVTGELRRYAPPPGSVLDATEIAAMLRRAADNPLAIPDPDRHDLERLFRQFAPVWEIDTASSADLPGRPVVSPAGRPQVVGEPVVYTLRSFARWQGRPLLQLNYVLWFPSRPRQGPLDLVGGNLDGLTWRVTLGDDGRPLFYDAMHNCGCYYHAFPTPRLSLATRRRGFEEPIAVPQAVADAAPRILLRVAAASHYLQRVHRHDGRPPDQRYAMHDYHRLRSLPLAGGGRRSLFRADGIVAGSERRERWLFWPMGVPEPGAMRQWGNHAIAFVGRRHFDDPDLLERYFAPAQ